ncbi:2OG-Fe(II) oxygenase [Denitromonas iodatirespirans]|uniref:2OG-Fe(II) oxygenase n=1 Tax=Denitromonas iodatirespirans TaxID=2795389 RepID=A0A944D686_DENI1|nr:2OG-Fe(II) oxygenase [Denitromonas iodatirespirans]MBT0960689.1 2OG-Fe(II) oxygenase [Denitromonas iodatirespirans]
MECTLNEETTAVAGLASNDEMSAHNEAVEAWLLAAVSRGDLSVEAMAQAMQADGYGEHEAQLLAALGVLRHEDTPLHSVLEHSRMQGAVLDVIQHFRYARLDALDAHRSPVDAPVAPSKVRGVRARLTCTSPDLALFDDVLSAHECSDLIEFAKEHLSANRVMSEQGEVIDADVRTSSGCFVEAGSVPWIDAIEARISTLVQWPQECMEELAIVRYSGGERFLSHFDYFNAPELLRHREELDAAGQRIGTIVLYLNDVTEGGATRFDVAGLELLPSRGSALYFTYRLPDGRMDEASLHSGTPVLEGEKWIATLWLRERPCRGLSAG